MKKHDLSSLDELSLKSKDDLEWFWKSVDEDIGIVWDSPYEKILDVSKGIAWSKWFVNGKTNIYKSSVEKFVKKTPDKIAYYFESEDGKTSQITYSELDSKVSPLANGLKSIGVKKGYVIAIYLPMIEDAILSILASATPVTRLVAPGPRVAKQTPASPVNRPYTSAIKAAPCSCRVRMNLI